MDLKERIQLLCKQNKVSMNKLETDLEFGKGYISKLGKSTPNVTKLRKIADYFGVSLDYLIYDELPDSKEITLTPKDERDIARDLDALMDKIETGEDSPLYYNGEEVDQESKELLRDAIGMSLRHLKIINKEKYNPRKNKK